MTQAVKYHVPVMLHKSIDGLNIRQDGIYVDATFGGGGHSAEILRRLGTGKLIAFDKDADSPGKSMKDERFYFINHDFIYLKNFLNYLNIAYIDGLIADLGVSSHQFDQPERGFSYRFDNKLDMRMDKDNPVSAYQVINEYEERQLTKIFQEFGEIKESKKLARVICQYRKSKPIETTGELEQLIRENTSFQNRKKITTLVFQALRIEVNNELNALKILLTTAGKVIKSGGRLVVISYHSLEDRLVKNFIRTGNFTGEPETDPLDGNKTLIFREVNKKVITPDKQEALNNSRARSAKMRIAEKL